MADRLPPPPFWRTPYFEYEVLARPDRRDIDMADVQRALDRPYRRTQQQDGRFRLWVWVAEPQRWLRVVVEADAETVHNAFWDRNFRP